MTQRSCNVCHGWHDLSEPWPEACAAHYERNKTIPASDARSTLYANTTVTRGHWKQDRDTGEMIPIDEWNAKFGGTSGITIIKDIEPYQAVTGRVVDGKIQRDYIGGRKQHRDHLRGTGTIEIGNEKQMPKDRDATPPGLKEDIARAMQRTGNW